MLSANKQLILLISLILLCVTACTTAQTEPPTVVIINSNGPVGQPSVDGFLKGMADLGFVEGETINYEIQTFTNNPNLEEEVTTALESAVNNPTGLIAVSGLTAVTLAKEVTAESQIPDAVVAAASEIIRE